MRILRRGFCTARTDARQIQGEDSLDVSGRAGQGQSVTRARAQRALKRAAGVRDRLVPPQPGVVVLCYHRVGGRSAATEIDLPTARFADQMALVAERGPQSIDDALVALRSRTVPVHDRAVVSFDDGTADFVDVALPILERHRVPAVLYVATYFIERGRAFPENGKPLSWAAIRDALSTGLVTLGSHTHSHALLDRVSEGIAVAEIDESVQLLCERANVVPEHFAYPKALAGNAAAQRYVRSHFRSAAIAGTRPNLYGATDPWRLARSPVQRSDGMDWFERKLAGGMRLEDDVRRWANRVRYIGATS
jgi:peptidoglycan/xylan/chitin deacetylase (PgdA/CDA1 family)